MPWYNDLRTSKDDKRQNYSSVFSDLKKRRENQNSENSSRVAEGIKTVYS